MSYAGQPVTVKVLHPLDDDDLALTPTNAAAAITITAPDGTVLVTSAAMVWDVTFLRWEYTWDTTGVAPGLYVARVDLVPTGSKATPRYIEIELLAGRAQDDSPRVGPCETWPYLPCADVEPENEGILASAATHVLWALSGQRYGFCDLTLRPCLPARCTTWEQWRWAPPVYFGLWAPPPWYSWPACACPTSGQPHCSCTDLSTLRLPGPIAQLTQVRVDGVDLDLTADVRVSRWRELARTDGGTWASCQDFTLEDGVGTTIVRYRKGRRVPPLAQLAMGELIVELAKSCRGQPCGLSARAKEVTRKGVIEVQFDPQIFLDKGRTGLPKCDLFLTTVNPHGLRRPSRVFRADATN